MTQIRARASATIDSPASAVYSMLADYRGAHPRILPHKHLRNLHVEQGGTGAGTVFSIETHLLGTTRTLRGQVEEPEPGRTLTETYLGSGEVTTFIVEPLEAGACEVTIRTEYTSGGISGLVERLLVPPLLRRVYTEELQNLAREAGKRSRT